MSQVRRLIAAGVSCLVAVLAAGDVARGQGVGGSPVPAQQVQQQPQQLKGKANHARGPQIKSEPGLGINRQRLTRHPNQVQPHHQGQAQPNASATPNNVRPKYAEALRRYRHERHDRIWWKQHYTVVVLVLGGYYYWDAGYWCPAWGYDSNYESYDYDGPIYTYGNLLPDQVILNVQRALKQLGYYEGGLTGSLGPASRQALANYQADAGLEVTGAIDAATVEALGLVEG